MKIIVITLAALLLSGFLQVVNPQSAKAEVSENGLIFFTETERLSVQLQAEPHNTDSNKTEEKKTAVAELQNNNSLLSSICK